MLGSVDPWVDLLIHWSTDPLMYRSTDLRRASSSLPLPSFSYDLKFLFPSALLFGSSITVGCLFRCPTIHSGFATVFAERLETSIYQYGRICGRWVDDVSLSISSSFKETLNRFCASWGKQPLPFNPVALRQIWLLANQVEYGRTRIGTLRHLVTCFSLNCFPQRSCTFFFLLLTHKVNSSWLCLSGFCFVCWFHIKNINYTTMLMLAYAPPPPPKKAPFLRWMLGCGRYHSLHTPLHPKISNESCFWHRQPRLVTHATWISLRHETLKSVKAEFWAI